MVPAPDRTDHLIYGTPDLDAGVEEIERRMGVRPGGGGRHPQYGTRNALLALGEETYLEVMAPDPELPEPDGGRLFALDELEAPRLVTWAVRAPDIDGAAARARDRGVELGAVESGRREQPDGTVLSWRLTDPRALPMDGVVPFLIDWGETPNPAAGARDGGELVGLTVRHPEPEAVRAALEAVGADGATVEEGARPELVAAVHTADGVVEIR